MKKICWIFDEIIPKAFYAGFLTFVVLAMAVAVAFVDCMDC